MTGDLPSWAARLREERTRRLWSQKVMAARLRAAADDHSRARLPSTESIRRRVRGHEAGQNLPSDLYAELYCRAFGITREALFGSAAASGEQVQALLHSGRQRSRQTRELLRIESDLLAHASLLLDDIDRDGTAGACGRAATLCAEEAGSSPALTLSAQAKTARWKGVRLGGDEGARCFQRSADLARRGVEHSSRAPVGVLLASQEASAAALLGDATRARQALRCAQDVASRLPGGVPWLSTWACPGPRQALYALSVAIRLRDPDEALRAAAAADAGWASGEPWLNGVWSLIRIGAAAAWVMKGDLDAAFGELGPVLVLAPGFRISTITSYLSDLDRLLRQRRFAGAEVARNLRAEIAAFAVAAAPAGAGREGRDV
ncbi:MAG TPA: hypothetical protein VNF47_18270 [Streptosporangiaceae bacterium]|nr:hypothetical protein [Streptosporangiaceae bacterium]